MGVVFQIFEWSRSIQKIDWYYESWSGHKTGVVLINLMIVVGLE